MAETIFNPLAAASGLMMWANRPDFAIFRPRKFENRPNADSTKSVQFLYDAGELDIRVSATGCVCLSALGISFERMKTEME